jgi:hypothetical protein
MSDEQPLAETGIFIYDLEPPPKHPFLEVKPTPLRDFSKPRPPRPRWAPPPLAEGFVRVEVDDDYYAGPGFSDWTASETEYPTRIFDVPREQYERWVSARDAYAAMQEEVGALYGSRTNPHPPSGWVRKDKPYQVQP